MIWTLGEKPVLSSRRVAMYVKTMYRWASQEDVGILDKNPLASFKMPKAPQRDEEIVVKARAAAQNCFDEDVSLMKYPKLKATIEEIESFEAAEFLEKN